MQALQIQKVMPKDLKRPKYDLPLNKRLKEARLRKKMSAAGVVRELKLRGIQLGVSTLQGYEADEHSSNHRYPPTAQLLALADYYEVSLDYLFGRSENILREEEAFTKEGVNKNIKLVLNSGEDILWGRKKITAKQCQLIKEHIEFLVNRL
jgi:transcriptional regulator with XRE-family HTH domain